MGDTDMSQLCEIEWIQASRGRDLKVPLCTYFQIFIFHVALQRRNLTSKETLCISRK